MVYLICGAKPVQGEGKKSGRPFDAYILHMTRENPRDLQLAGVEVKQQFVDKALLMKDVQKLGSYQALIGMEIDLSFDPRGFIDDAVLKYPAK